MHFALPSFPLQAQRRTGILKRIDITFREREKSKERPGEDCRGLDEDSLCSADNWNGPMREALLLLKLSRFAANDTLT